jgi:hypothetical protein
MVSAMIRNLEQWIGRQLPKLPRVRLDPARIDKQRRRAPVLAAASRSAPRHSRYPTGPHTSKVSATTRSVVGSRRTSPGTSSPHATGRSPEYRWISVSGETESPETDLLADALGSRDPVGSVAVAGTGLVGGSAAARSVDAGVGTLLERPASGAQAGTAQVSIPSRKVRRLRSNAISRRP